MKHFPQFFAIHVAVVIAVELIKEFFDRRRQVSPRAWAAAREPKRRSTAGSTKTAAAESTTRPHASTGSWPIRPAWTAELAAFALLTASGVRRPTWSATLPIPVASLAFAAVTFTVGTIALTAIRNRPDWPSRCAKFIWRQFAVAIAIQLS